MPRRTRYGRITAWLGLVLTLLLAGCGERQAAPEQDDSGAATTENDIAAYLRDAEIQAETDGQRRTLREALEDLIEQPDAELLAARYAGPDGPTQRDVAQVLRAHIAPARPIVSPRWCDASTLSASCVVVPNSTGTFSTYR